MLSEETITETLDAKGQVCPMPLAMTKGAIDGLAAGEVLEVLSTEANSVPDFESWASMTDGVELVDQVQMDADGEAVYRHFVKRTG